MNANDDYEAFAERFYKKFGFLPLGKDDPCRPSAETILARLGETFGELERAESAAQHTTQAKAAEALPDGKICPVCEGLGVVKEKTPVGSWTDTCKKCCGSGKLPLA